LYTLKMPCLPRYSSGTGQSEPGSNCSRMPAHGAGADPGGPAATPPLGVPAGEADARDCEPPIAFGCSRGGSGGRGGPRGHVPPEVARARRRVSVGIRSESERRRATTSGAAHVTTGGQPDFSSPTVTRPRLVRFVVKRVVRHARGELRRTSPDARPSRRHGVHRLHPRGRGEQQAGHVQRRRDALPELDLAASIQNRAPPDPERAAQKTGGVLGHAAFVRRQQRDLGRAQGRGDLGADVRATYRPRVCSSRARGSSWRPRT
jgi:hypothetical protein